MLRTVLGTMAIFSCLSVIAFACAAGDAQSAPAILSRFQTALKDVPAGDERAEKAHAFAAALSERERVELGRALAVGTSMEDALFGASLLVDGGLPQEAAPVFARFVIGGGDMTAYFWQWLHGDDPKTATRAYIAISRALLGQIDGLDGQRRRAAEAFLLDDSFGQRIGTYSRKAVEDKLDALERQLK